MSVTEKNILVGVHDFKIDGTSVGSTIGGVTITKSVDTLDKNIDQELSVVGLAKTAENYEVSTEVAETDLTNIKTLWDVPNTVEGSDPETLSLGIEEDVTYKTLEFEGETPDGYTRTYHFYKAFISDVGDTVLSKEDIAVIPVTFRVFADTSKPSGKRIGYIEDAAS